MSELSIILILPVIAIAMLAVNKPLLDVVALIMLVALPFTGMLIMGESPGGFSDANIVLIAALFVIGGGLLRTGVPRRLGDWLIATAGRCNGPGHICWVVQNRIASTRDNLRLLVASRGTQKRHKLYDFEWQPGGPDGNALGGL
jgi:hypothetical protein